MKTSKSFYRDVMTGLFFITGVLYFLKSISKDVMAGLFFGVTVMVNKNRTPV
jgi:hypothetical protein